MLYVLAGIGCVLLIIAIQYYRYHRLKISFQKMKNYLSELDKQMIVSISDQQGNITYVNDRFAQISQHSKEYLIGKNHRIFKSGYHPQSFYASMWQTLLDGKVYRGEICNRAKDGSIYWMDSTIIPLLDRHRQIKQFVSIKTDITQRKAMEEMLKANQERFELYLQASDNGIWDWDLVNEKTYYSKRFQELIGYSFRELPATFALWEDLIHDEDRPAVVDALRRHLYGQKHLMVECRIRIKQGGYRWFAIQGQAVWDGQGKPERIVGSLSDIHERKLTQQIIQGVQKSLEEKIAEKTIELKKSEEMFRLLVQQMHDYALFFVDPNGTIASWNEGAEAMTGWRVDEIIGQKYTVLSLTDSQDNQHNHNRLNKTYEGVVKWDGWCHTKNGQRVKTRIVWTPIYSYGGEFNGYSLLMKDLSDGRSLN